MSAQPYLRARGEPKDHRRFRHLEIWRTFKAINDTSKRRLRCAHQRMQLVVMTTVLALAGASKLCSSGCSLQVYTIPVESCNKTEYVDTTFCAGQCYHEDPVYLSATRQTEQNVCNGNWTYKVKHIRGCSVGVSYPVATSCKCTSCNEDYTDCAARINHSCF